VKSDVGRKKISGKRLAFALRASGDAVGIFRYLANEAGDEAAERYLRDLYEKMEWIARSGTSGVPRDHIRPGLKSLPFKSHLIYFRVTEEECTIVRILHRRRDVSGIDFSE